MNNSFPLFKDVVCGWSILKYSTFLIGYYGKNFSEKLKYIHREVEVLSKSATYLLLFSAPSGLDPKDPGIKYLYPVINDALLSHVYGRAMVSVRKRNRSSLENLLPRQFQY